MDQVVSVGQRITPPSGETASDEGGAMTGYIHPAYGNLYNPNAYVDPLTAGHAAARAGAIIAVNAIPGQNQLPVWWFRKNAADESQGFTPLYWPVVIGTHTIQWPSSADEIVLASNEGSGTLPAAEQAGSLYYQNDSSQTGYNPNEEHALMLDGRVDAIRDDLNITSGANYSSEPYALLQYAESDGRPAMHVFKVLREKSAAGIAFDYVIEAGQPGAAMLTGGDYILQSGFWSLELAIQTPGASYLSVKRVGANVEISWPAGAIGFSLEATGSLVGTINWSGVGQTPATVDGQNVVALPVQPGQRFFRLRKP